MLYCVCIFNFTTIKTKAHNNLSGKIPYQLGNLQDMWIFTAGEMIINENIHVQKTSFLIEKNLIYDYYVFESMEQRIMT